jgi:hypothetical protein
MAWVKEKKQTDKRALLKSRIEMAQAESRAFLEDRAAEIAKQCPGVPYLAVLQNIRRGLCDCVAAITVMDHAGD